MKQEIIVYEGREYTLKRYPPTDDRSLRVASAADELLLSYAAIYLASAPATLSPWLLHDRFGLLATCLHPRKPWFIASFRSQEKALASQLAENKIPTEEVRLLHLFEELPRSSLGLMRLPKSLDLFECYLASFARAASADAELVVGFMTRHFSAGMLAVAQRYASTIEQSKASKKARLLHLKGFIQDSPAPQSMIREIDFADTIYQQYYGVFSAEHIDYATQFLLANWPSIALPPEPQIVDMACGNGIIGYELKRHYPTAKVSFVDDFYLAIASARLNNKVADQHEFLYNDSLDPLVDATTDLVVTNPPFHFGFENNISVSLQLFAAAKRVLKPGAPLIVVANKHLNYATHLSRLFPSVKEIASNDKFVLYQAQSQQPTA